MKIEIDLSTVTLEEVAGLISLLCANLTSESRDLILDCGYYHKALYNDLEDGAARIEAAKIKKLEEENKNAD